MKKPEPTNGSESCTDSDRKPCSKDSRRPAIENPWNFLFYAAVTLSASAVLYLSLWLMQPPPALSDVSYGNDLCLDYNSTRLRYGSFSHFVYNLISVKNVYFASYGGEAVVLKKLGHRSELARIADPKTDLFGELTRLESVKFCDVLGTKFFLDEALVGFTPKQIGTLVQINIEPLMLHVFRELHVFPEYMGACGHFVVVRDCGRPLGDFATADWHIRAFLAMQLLQAARDMTEHAGEFRLYLTDISPDNIAVDSSLNVYFVDVENAIVSGKDETNPVGQHHSEHSNSRDFAFDTSEICRSEVSDHNIYGVCWLLLSHKAPWPMMRGGLLHSPPNYLKVQYAHLSRLVEECVRRPYKTDRFTTSLTLIQMLQKILLIN